MYKNIKEISIIIPVRNEEASIALIARDCTEQMKNTPYKYKIIIVDDGSDDNTVQRLKGSQCNF